MSEIEINQLPAHSDKVPGTASFSKFMTAIQFIADSPANLTVADFLKKAPFPRGTAHRILAALMSEGIVSEDSRSQYIQLGPRLMNLASLAWSRFDLRLLAEDFIRNLRDVTGETVHLAVPSGTEMVYIDKLESLQAVRMTSRIGARVFLHSTAVGKAYLAGLDKEQRGVLVEKLELHPKTVHTLVDRQALLEDVEETVRRGYSIDNEETEFDIICFGSSIRGARGQVVGCVSITVPKYRLSQAAELACTTGVMDCARRISAQIPAVPSQG